MNNLFNGQPNMLVNVPIAQKMAAIQNMSLAQCQALLMQYNTPPYQQPPLGIFAPVAFEFQPFYQQPSIPANYYIAPAPQESKIKIDSQTEEAKQGNDSKETIKIDSNDALDHYVRPSHFIYFSQRKNLMDSHHNVSNLNFKLGKTNYNPRK